MAHPAPGRGPPPGSIFGVGQTSTASARLKMHSTSTVTDAICTFPSVLGEWHERPNQSDASLQNEPLILHALNLQLWHLEDYARSRTASDAQVARSKRAIDRTNVRRNQVIEQMDLTLQSISPPGSVCEIVSETPGMLVDRLSVLAIRRYHTALTEHPYPLTIDERSSRIRTLDEQWAMLCSALQYLIRDVQAGRKSFKVYQQFKTGSTPEQKCVDFETICCQPLS
jgi:Protein of unknown function (DUF4254)